MVVSQSPNLPLILESVQLLLVGLIPHLKTPFFHALNDPIKDELAILDEPSSLNELISLATCLDNQLRECGRERSKRTNYSQAPPTVRFCHTMPSFSSESCRV